MFFLFRFFRVLASVCEVQVRLCSHESTRNCVPGIVIGHNFACVCEVQLHLCLNFSVLISAKRIGKFMHVRIF